MDRSVETCRGESEMTGRSLVSMLIFAGIIVAVMWFFVLPALTTFRPTLP
jgi:nitrogen fixation protein FixH